MIWVIGLLFAALLAISFIFSGLETALLTITPARLRHESGQGSRNAKRLSILYEDRIQLLTIVMLISHACNIFAFGLMVLELSILAGPWGYLIAFVIALPIYLLWVELVPKSIFRRFPFRLLSRFVWILEIVLSLSRPLVWLIGKSVDRFVAARRQPLASLDQGREAFRELTALIQREGTLTEDETALIQHTLDFDKVTARQLMVPLSKVTSVPLDMPLTDIAALARETDLDQFPVMSKSGELVGQVRIIEILKADPETSQLTDFVRRLLKFGGDEKAILVLQKLRYQKVELALVVRGNGRAMGIISSHDIVQKLLTPEAGD